jgi:type I restriction enzyme S subunit
MNANTIDMTPEHRRLAAGILRAHLPRRATVWAFGSRTTGQSRRYSDLDLAIDAGRLLSLDEIAALAEAFSDSDLPYRVDIVDWRSIDAEFGRLIAADRLPLLDGAPRAEAGK